MDGNLSSKRVAAFVALACIAAGFVSDTFFDHHPSEYMMNDLMFIVLGGLGYATAERFAPKAPQ